MVTSGGLSRITNGDFDLAVDPALGRIQFYGPGKGPNFLWTNPRARESGSPFFGWLNWGGDKVWIWPERDWKAWHGVHAPPGDPSPSPYRIDCSNRTLRMTSPEIPAYGLRIVREITLDEKGAGLTLLNRLEKVSETRCQNPVGVWIVTQIPAAQHIFARLLGETAPRHHASFENGEWKNIREQHPLALLERPRDVWAKIGLEADLLSASYDEYQFTIMSSTDTVAEDFEPFCRAQVFSDPDHSQFRVEGVPPYIELEFTSPMKRLRVGESIDLKQRWMLTPPVSASFQDFKAFLNHALI